MTPSGGPSVAALPFRLSGYGIAFRSHWPLAGSQALPEESAAGRHPTRIRPLTDEEDRLAWQEPAELVFRPSYPDGRVRFTVERSARGYRLWFAGFGRYLVSEDGLLVGCRTQTASSSRRERFLFAQALPLASVLRGHELLHASAVAARGGVAALSGPSGAGKSSLASRLVARGARFFTDDVLALEERAGEVLAHPGPAFLALPAADRDLLGDAGGRLGEEIGESDKIHLSPPLAEAALPLRALYRIEPGERFAIEELGAADPRDLLSRFHAPFVMTPARLRRQLEVSASIAAGVAQFRLTIPRNGFPDSVVEQVGSHLGAL